MGCRRRTDLAAGSYRRRLRLEPLEDRRLLATITVNTLVDEIDGIGVGGISLREAIAASMPGDTIDFDAALTDAGSETILLDHGELRINKSVAILGPGAEKLTIDAQGRSRILHVDDDDHLTQIDVQVAGLSLTDGNQQNGGAIYNWENLTLTLVEISDSFASYGGGIHNVITGDLTITHSSISNNEAGKGGGIYNSARMTILDSAVTGNETLSSGIGGGIYSSGGLSSLTVLRSTISGNEAGFRGGGIDNLDGNVTVTDSTISGNSAVEGAGITNLNGRLTVSGSTISGNQANNSGGGILTDTELTGSRRTTITNSTISGNWAGSIGGGGILNRDGLTVIRHSTITQNGGPTGPGIAVASFGSSLTRTDIYSSIIAANLGNDVAYVALSTNSFQSLGYNIVGFGNATGAFNRSGDQTTVTQPRLGPLQDNGGLTMTHALLASSPAIDAGKPGLVAGMVEVPLHDQRGDAYTRVFDGDQAGGAQIDIGAYELIPDDVVHALFGDYNRDGRVDAGDYVRWRNTLNASGLDPYEGTDGNGDMMVGIEDYQVWKAHYGELVPEMGAGPSTALRTGGWGGLSAAFQEVEETGPPETQVAAATGLAVARGLVRQELNLADSRWRGDTEQAEGGVRSVELFVAPNVVTSVSRGPTVRGAAAGVSVARQDAATILDEALVAWLALRGEDAERREFLDLSFGAADRDDSATDAALEGIGGESIRTLP